MTVSAGLLHSRGNVCCEVQLCELEFWTLFVSCITFSWPQLPHPWNGNNNRIQCEMEIKGVCILNTWHRINAQEIIAIVNFIIFIILLVTESCSPGCIKSEGLKSTSVNRRVSLVAQLGKNPPAMQETTCQCRRRGFDSWVRKIPWRRKWLPTPVFLPGKSHG